MLPESTKVGCRVFVYHFAGVQGVIRSSFLAASNGGSVTGSPPKAFGFCFVQFPFMLPESTKVGCRVFVYHFAGVQGGIRSSFLAASNGGSVTGSPPKAFAFCFVQFPFIAREQNVGFLHARSILSRSGFEIKSCRRSILVASGNHIARRKPLSWGIPRLRVYFLS